MSKLNLTDLRALLRLPIRAPRVGGSHAALISVDQSRLFFGELLPQEIQLRTVREVFEWRDRFHSMKKPRVRAALRFAHNNGARPHTALANNPPMSAARPTEASQGNERREGIRLFNFPNMATS